MQSTNRRQMKAALVDQAFFRSARVSCAIGIVVAERRKKGSASGNGTWLGWALVSGGKRADRARWPHASLVKAYRYAGCHQPQRSKEEEHEQRPSPPPSHSCESRA
jgi:hypothetical protein